MSMTLIGSPAELLEVNAKFWNSDPGWGEYARQLVCQFPGTAAALPHVELYGVGGKFSVFYHVRPEQEKQASW